MCRRRRQVGWQCVEGGARETATTAWPGLGGAAGTPYNKIMNKPTLYVVGAWWKQVRSHTTAGPRTAAINCCPTSYYFTMIRFFFYHQNSPLRQKRIMILSIIPNSYNYGLRHFPVYTTGLVINIAFIQNKSTINRFWQENPKI